MSSIEKDRSAKRKFGIALAVITAGIALVSMWRGRESLVIPLFGLCALFLLVSLFFPVLLTPLYSGMMRLSRYLGWLNTRILLILIYYLVFTPVAIVFRIMGKDPLSRKFEREKATYWMKKEPRDRDTASHFEKQF